MIEVTASDVVARPADELSTHQGGLTGLLRLLDPFTERMVRRSVRGDYERLADLLVDPHRGEP